MFTHLSELGKEDSMTEMHVNKSVLKWQRSMFLGLHQKEMVVILWQTSLQCMFENLTSHLCFFLSLQLKWKLGIFTLIPFVFIEDMPKSWQYCNGNIVNSLWHTIFFPMWKRPIIITRALYFLKSCFMSYHNAFITTTWSYLLTELDGQWKEALLWVSLCSAFMDINPKFLWREHYYCSNWGIKRYGHPTCFPK